MLLRRVKPEVARSEWKGRGTALLVRKITHVCRSATRISGDRQHGEAAPLGAAVVLERAGRLAHLRPHRAGPESSPANRLSREDRREGLSGRGGRAAGWRGVPHHPGAAGTRWRGQ